MALALGKLANPCAGSENGFRSTALSPATGMSRLGDVNRWRIFLFAGLAAGSACAAASPASDLASPAPQVRSQAARLIREQHLYQSTARAPWDGLGAMLQPGESMPDVFARVHAQGPVPPVFAPGEPRRITLSFQLDDSWNLACQFDEGRLVDWEINEQPRLVAVPPPPNYTGFWRTYRLDGTTGTFLVYHNGKCLGTPGDGGSTFMRVEHTTTGIIEKTTVIDKSPQ